MKKRLEFPEGFLWGASTSAHQVEGGLVNSWSKWEKEQANILSERAKAKWETWQQERFPEMFDPQNYISGNAADHYTRFDEDFALAESLGHGAHRFSIDWSRVEPEEGQFNEAELLHYKDVIISLRKHGLEPFVTLWHWPLPLWLSDKGGWRSKDTSNYFGRYTQRVVETLGSEVTFWITLNEPMVFASHSYLRGAWPPQEKSYFAYRRVVRHLIQAHKRAFEEIKKADATSKVCVAKHSVYFEAYKNRLVNKALKRIADWWWNDSFLKAIEGYQDVITLNNYHHNRIHYGFRKNENEKRSDLGWELYPESLAQMARELAKYNLPIYVTEHGLADADDTNRAWFIKESLAHLHKAIEEGVDVRGYLHWSLLDNFEWDKGFWPRFGLIEVDFKTQERTVRPSAHEYAQICKENAVEYEV